jgi:hypothetical protein
MPVKIDTTADLRALTEGFLREVPGTSPLLAMVREQIFLDGLSEFT